LDQPGLNGVIAGWNSSSSGRIMSRIAIKKESDEVARREKAIMVNVICPIPPG
jgi:hypothetical protein